MALPDLGKCPECGYPLEADEVDVGVGVIYGNYGCPNCHWTPPLRAPDDYADYNDRVEGSKDWN